MAAAPPVGSSPQPLRLSGDRRRTERYASADAARAPLSEKEKRAEAKRHPCAAEPAAAAAAALGSSGVRWATRETTLGGKEGSKAG